MINEWLISIITTAYNSEKYIAETIRSILKQTYPKFELIIIDDCSTDNTYPILEEFQKQDQRIKLIKNDCNRKQAFSRNKAINLAGGKYIAFIDADDIAHPDRLKTQLEFMELNPNIDVCGSYYSLFNANGIKFKQKPPITHAEIECQMRLFGNCIAFPSTFIKTSVIKKFMFNESMEGNAEDYELWIRMLDKQIVFWNIPKYLLYYRVHSSQASQTNLSPIYSLVNSIRYKALKNLFPTWTDTKINDAILIMMNSKVNLNLFRYFMLLRKIYHANLVIKYFDNLVLKKTLNRISIKKRFNLKLNYLLLNMLDK